MKKLWGALVLTMVLWMATVAAAAPEQLPGRLYDIRGPILPPGLPPFAASATLLLATAIGVIFFRLRRNKPQSQAPAAAEISIVAASNELSDLKNAYLRGELSESVLFDRLMPYIRNLIPGAEQVAATNYELIKLAKARSSAERSQRLTALLELCDRVRFGRGNPGKELTLQVLDDIRNDIEQPAEDSR